MMAAGDRIEVLRGTLDLLVLKVLENGALHGYGLTKELETLSEGAFQVNPGTIFPMLHQLEEEGWIEGEWGTTDTNRRAKFYALTELGRRQLERRREHWRRLSGAIEAVLET